MPPPLGRSGPACGAAGPDGSIWAQVTADHLGGHPPAVDLDRERLLAESRALAKLRHESVVLVHDVVPFDADLLLAIAEQFSLDFASLAEDDESRLYNDVMDAFGDRLFEEVELTTTDVRELVTASPQAARALLTLYDAYHKTLTDARSLAAQMTDGDEGGYGILGRFGGSDPRNVGEQDKEQCFLHRVFCGRVM